MTSDEFGPLEQMSLEVGGAPNPFVILATYAIAIGAANIREWVAPGACWYARIDDTWEAWLNPHSVDAIANLSEKSLAKTAHVPPYECYITYNGWPWAAGHPFTITHVEHPDTEAANVATFYRACRAAAGLP